MWGERTRWGGVLGGRSNLVGRGVGREGRGDARDGGGGAMRRGMGTTLEIKDYRKCTHSYSNYNLYLHR